MVAPFPQRVLLTADTVGGVWIFATELASQLRNRGMEVKLATFGPKLPLNLPGECDWSHFPSKLEWMQDPWSDIERGAAWLRSIAYDFKPDLVHLNTLSFADLGFNAPVIVTVHSCVCSWWESVKQSTIPAEWRHYRIHVEHCLRHADLVTAPTEAMLVSAASHYGIDISNALTIYNGIESKNFHIASPEPFILSAGRLWDEAKNMTAVAAVADKVPWPIYLAGNPRHPDGSQAAFPNCHLLGELDQSQLCDWYARAAIYAAPAKYEPFGLSILEAACSGCALVLGDIPTLREVWLDSALYVSTSDDLHHALNCLIENPSLRDKMAERALHRAQHFTSAQMTQGYLNAYSRMFACVS